MNDKITLVSATTEEHFSAMSLIHAEGWRVAYKGMLTEEYFRQEITDDRWVPVFRGHYENGTGHGLLCYRGDAPVGCITFGPARLNLRPDGKQEDMHADAYTGWGEIFSFYSHPAEIGKGYGHLLMEEACKRLREAGFRNCFVLVNAEKPLAIKFYAAHGFSHDGTQIELDYDGAVCIDLRYTKQL